MPADKPEALNPKEACETVFSFIPKPSFFETAHDIHVLDGLA
jgi:hypothetical protein